MKAAARPAARPFRMAESADEEFVYVIEGEPDVWIDGHLHRLKPGDAVGFPAGTGIAAHFPQQHGGRGPPARGREKTSPGNRVFYPLHPERKPLHPDWWDGHPTHDLGPHDGMTDQRRMGEVATEAAASLHSSPRFQGVQEDP